MSDENNSEDTKTLGGQEAIDLWLSGKDAWNKWVEEHPDYNVDFSGVDFANELQMKNIKSDYINFREFIFPDGESHFIGAIFNKNTYFTNAHFKGNISFIGAIFNNSVSYSIATFSKEISFNSALFKSEARFSDTTFNKVARFEGTIFLKESNFIAARFFEKADFIRTEFTGKANFSRAIFKNGSDFGYAIFSQDIYFFAAQISGEILFGSAKFKESALFISLLNIKGLESFSFKYAVFDGPLDISSGKVFPCLIDLTNTKISHHVSLAGVNCELPREKNRESKFFPNGDWATQKTASEPLDIERARRLKELAENNKDYDKAKDFFVLELQAKRKFNGIYARAYGFLLNPEFWYEKLSDYGRSIKRPLGWLIFIWLLWAEVYIAANLLIKKGGIEWGKGFAYSAAQMLAFIPSSRDARRLGVELFGDPMPDWIYLLTFPQSLIALILLFLLGLGLRHKFRI